MNWIKRLGYLAYFMWKTFGKKITQNETITNRQILLKLKKFTDSKNIFIGDRNYNVLDLDTMKWLISIMPIKYITYQAETYDCEDFSMTFLGLFRLIVPNIPIGMCWNKKHSYLCFVASDGIVYGIEPQTNEVFKFDDVDIKLIVM